MRIAPSIVASAVVLAFIAGSGGVAQAKDPPVTGKGIVGGGLLGGELVLAVEAAFDVQSPWAYLGGGVAGAAAGAVGGYFVEQNASARVPMLLLAGGLTLAIPTTVAVLSATSYEPPATYVQDQPPPDEPVADPARSTVPPATPSPGTTTSPTAPGATPPTGPSPATGPAPSGSQQPSGALPHRSRSRAIARRRLPPALIDVSSQQLSLSIPAIEFRDVFTRAEVAMGAPKATEVRIPVLNVVF